MTNRPESYQHESVPPADTELSTATRAAWLHYTGGLTQAEVADRLGTTRLKAHRLIARATREGLVRVFIDGEIAETMRLENHLARHYGLGFCQVAPTIDDMPLPLQALGALGARFLRAALESGRERLIGVGHGRTLAACVAQLPRMQAGSTRFVSLLGGLTRRLAANPHDVIHRLAERTGAEAYVLPVPLIANSEEDRAIMMAQRGIAEVLALARQAGLLLVGVGAVGSQASLSMTGMIEPDEVREVKRAGACGEILGHYFDAEGGLIDTGVSRRTCTLDIEDLRGRRIVAIAGGTAKTRAIGAALASGLLHGLITDERTAAALQPADAEARPTLRRKAAI